MNRYFVQFGPADIGDEFGDVRPLDAAHMRALTVNGVHLLDHLDPNTAFVSELASPTVGCITWPQRDHLVNIAPVSYTHLTLPTILRV